MSRHRAFLGALIIPTGTDSNVLGARELEMAVGLEFELPAAIAETITIRTGTDENTVFANTYPWQPAGTTITLTGGPLRRFVEGAVGRSVAAQAGVGVAASRTINVWAILDTPDGR